MSAGDPFTPGYVADQNLANQLAEFMPSEDILGPGGKLVREGTGLQTLFQRIEAMQSDPELQRQFFQGHKSWGGASFEQRSQAPIQSLLTNANSTFSKNLQSAFETIAPDVATVEQINHNLRFAGNQALANIQRRLDTAAVLDGLEALFAARGWRRAA